MKFINYTILEAIKKVRLFRSANDNRIIIPLFDKESIIVDDNTDTYGILCLSISKPNDTFFTVECYDACWTSDDDDDEDDRLAKMIVFDDSSVSDDENLTTLIEPGEKDIELAKSLIAKDYDVVYSKSIFTKLNNMFNRLYRPDTFAKEEIHTLD